MHKWLSQRQSQNTSYSLNLIPSELREDTPTNKGWRKFSSFLSRITPIRVQS